MVGFSSNDDFFIVQVNTHKEFKEIELLLLARAIPFSSRNVYWQKQFYISHHQADYSKKEIRSFLEENENWPPVDTGKGPQTFRYSWINIWMIVSLAFFHWQTTRIDKADTWLDLGRFSADRVLEGDWWRLATPLTLHVDDAHLLSNMLGLAVFVGGVNTFVGVGLSWLLVTLAAMGGNYFNALFYQVAHDSIGASTAVFAAVGLNGIFGIRHYYQKKQFKGRILVPFMAGFGLFAMLGTNPQTDVTAHLFGFFSGALVGVLFLPFSNHKLLKNKAFQFFSFTIFCLIIYGSWMVPLKTG
jgi:membrane associated rhomboid family serine protease